MGAICVRCLHTALVLLRSLVMEDSRFMAMVVAVARREAFRPRLEL
jgi:hypothetical protein